MSNHILPNQEVVGNTDRTGDKTLNLQQFFAMSFGLSVENIYYIAIVVLACILGAEIAGICMLIGKMRRARKGDEDVSNDEYNGGAGYAIAALSFGAVSATAELALLVLAIACAAGAFVLCILLAVCHAKGYLLISAKDEKLAKEQPAAQAYAPVDYPEQGEYDDNTAVAEQPVAEEQPVVEERPVVINQDTGLDHSYDDDVEAQRAVANLIDTEEEPQEEPTEEIEETIEETDEEIHEEAVEEPAAQEPTESAEVAVVVQDPNAAAAQSVQTVERTVLAEGTPGYAGQAPVIEKHIIETTKEVYKEVNTTTVTTDVPATKPEEKPVPDELLRAIDELKQLSVKFRLNSEVAVVNPAQANNDMDVPTVINMDEEDPDLVGRAESAANGEKRDPDRIDGEDGENEKDGDGDGDKDYDYYDDNDDIFGSERIVGYDEETGCHILARYRKSCEAKLIQARPETKKYYSAIRNALMGYEGTKERMSWTIDTYTNEHTQIAKINVRSRSLDLYLALDPSTLEDSVYNGRDVGAKKKYAETPFLYRVNSPRKLALALELVQRTCEELGLSPIDIEEVRYEEQYPYTDTQILISRGLIREYLREGRLAATFELDPDHVPQLIEEDQTVIPANANFTWEFDNDQPAAEEEPVIEEPVIEEPVVEEEPIVEVVEEEPVVIEEPAPAEPVSGTTTTTTTHETIRTTERHYTERYYGAGAAQVSEQTRTIEVLPEATAEPIEAAAEEITPEVAEEPIAQEQPTEDVPAEDVAEEIAEDAAEESEESEEELPEISEEESAEEIHEIQSSVAALFGDDVNEEDEPEEEPAYEDEHEAEPEEEPAYEDEPEAEPEEEPAYEDEPEAEPEEEPTYEDEPEAEPVYEDEPEEEPTYEDEPDADPDQVYENFDENEFEDSYQEEEGEDAEEAEEAEEEKLESPAPAPAPRAVPVTNSDVVRLDVCIFDDYFENGAVINLETLKQVGLAPENATTLKLFATGSINGEFIVEANHFTIDAIRAIGEAGGDSVMIR